MRALSVLLLTSLLLALPGGGAQTHGHGAGGTAMAVVLHDGPDGGRAVVGGLTHFGFALVGTDGRPTEHLDASFEVTQDNVTVFASGDTHEYDGLFSFDVTFLRPGPYRVVARSEGFEAGVFEGVAVEPVYETSASLVFDLASAPASNAVSGTLSIVDGTGALIPHTDAIVEVRGAPAQRLVSRFHLHVHEEPMAFSFAPGAPGDYTLSAVAYRAFPTGRSADVRAVVAEHAFTVGAAALPAPPALPSGVPDPLSPVGASAEGEGYALHGMVDPQAQVGVGTPFRLSALAVGPSGLPQPHVDFELTVTGPVGQVFHSASLHEYDGVFEWVYNPTVPGVYDATLSAKLGNGTLTVPYQVQVLPPAAPLGAGPNVLTAKGLDAPRAGVPQEVVFAIDGPSGPLAHSEVDVTLMRPGGAPLQQFKLHTHDTGRFTATLLFPEEGDWLVRVDAFPLLPQAAVVQGPDGPGAPVLLKVAVGAAPADASGVLGAERETGEARVPAPALVALLAVALVAAGLRPRR